MANYMNLAEDRLKTLELNYSQDNRPITNANRSNDSLWNRMVNNLTSIAFGTPNNTTPSYAQTKTLGRSAPTNHTSFNHDNAALSHSVNAKQSRVNNVNNNATSNVITNVNNSTSQHSKQQSDPKQLSNALDSLKSKFCDYNAYITNILMIDIEPRLKEMILNEIIDSGSVVTFDDIGEF